jgi:hypothetical protein
VTRIIIFALILLLSAPYLPGGHKGPVKRTGASGPKGLDPYSFIHIDLAENVTILLYCLDVTINSFFTLQNGIPITEFY